MDTVDLEYRVKIQQYGLRPLFLVREDWPSTFLRFHRREPNEQLVRSIPSDVERSHREREP